MGTACGVLRDPESVGGGKRDRTADLLHAMQALSQLSYTPKAKGAHYSHPPLARNRAALRKHERHTPCTNSQKLESGFTRECEA